MTVIEIHKRQVIDTNSIADAAFARGYACCLANAIRCGIDHPENIFGGFTIQAFKEAKVDPYDLKVLRKALK